MPFFRHAMKGKNAAFLLPNSATIKAQMLLKTHKQCVIFDLMAKETGKKLGFVAVVLEI